MPKVFNNQVFIDFLAQLSNNSNSGYEKGHGRVKAGDSYADQAAIDFYHNACIFS